MKLDRNRIRIRSNEFEKKKKRNVLTKNSRNLNQISRAFLSPFLSTRQFLRSICLAGTRARLSIRKQIFQSPSATGNPGEGVEIRSAGWFTPFFTAHVTSVGRRSMLSLPVISQGNRRTVVVVVPHRSVFLPCAKRDINTFYLYLRTNDCEKGERERKEMNFKASSMIYIYIKFVLNIKLNIMSSERYSWYRDNLTLICLKIGGNNNGIKKSKLRVNKRTIARF